MQEKYRKNYEKNTENIINDERGLLYMHKLNQRYNYTNILIIKIFRYKYTKIVIKIKFA